MKPEDARRVDEIRANHDGNWNCTNACDHRFLLRVIEEQGKELLEAGDEIDRVTSRAESGELSELKEQLDIVRHRCRDRGTTLEEITNHLDMIRSGDTCRAECAACGHSMTLARKDPA